MHVVVTGASGLVGSALVAALTSEGHTVTRLTRAPGRGRGWAQWDPAAGVLDPMVLRGAGAVCHLAGRTIGGRSRAARREILESRVRGTRLVAETMARLEDGPRVLLCASGIHFYGDQGDEILTEERPAGRGFLAGVVRAWEEAAEPARSAGLRVAHLRMGAVQTPTGGALKRILPLFRLGLGGRFGSGRQWWSWVSLDDAVAAWRYALTDERLDGPVNVTAPEPVTNAEYTAALARVLRRPAALPIPRLGPRLLLGRVADELLFCSLRAVPAKLQAAGFTFRHPELEPALRELLGRPSPA